MSQEAQDDPCGCAESLVGISISANSAHYLYYTFQHTLILQLLRMSEALQTNLPFDDPPVQQYS